MNFFATIAPGRKHFLQDWNAFRLSGRDNIGSYINGNFEVPYASSPLLLVYFEQPLTQDASTSIDNWNSFTLSGRDNIESSINAILRFHMLKFPPFFLLCTFIWLNHRPKTQALQSAIEIISHRLAGITLGFH